MYADTYILTIQTWVWSFISDIRRAKPSITPLLEIQSCQCSCNCSAVRNRKWCQSWNLLSLWCWNWLISRLPLDPQYERDMMAALITKQVIPYQRFNLTSPIISLNDWKCITLPKKASSCRYNIFNDVHWEHRSLNRLFKITLRITHFAMTVIANINFLVWKDIPWWEIYGEVSSK